MKRWIPGLLAVGWVACTPSTSIPGNEVMGTFNFQAKFEDGGFGPTLLDGGGFVELPSDAGFAFQAILSRNTPALDGGGFAAFMTLNGESRDAGFDGRNFFSEESAPRAFDSCNLGGTCAQGVLVDETISFVVLSKSEAVASGGLCQGLATDGGGGIPTGAGITPPGTTPSGFDAQLACGQLVDVFTPGPGCTCDAGVAVFGLSGARQ